MGSFFRNYHMNFNSSTAIHCIYCDVVREDSLFLVPGNVSFHWVNFFSLENLGGSIFFQLGSRRSNLFWKQFLKAGGNLTYDDKCTKVN